MSLKNNKIIRYLREAKRELEKVSWPTQQQTVRYAIIIIILSAILAVYFGGIDYLFNKGLEALIKLTTN
ncbi:preprotein translocase subunit SecE [Candidatus Parcubacteria bacterium]|nr:MAG: preprotein translocase subunit SecE [Candidatus Parcubacteria bacterium]